MTLTIELSPQVEQRLQETAAREGVDPAVYVQRLLENQLVPLDMAAIRKAWEKHEPGVVQESLLGKIPLEEWMKLADEWIASHDDWPDLPDEAYTRESFYEGRP